MSALVVDTSVWIDFFSGREVPALEDALFQGNVVLPPIVIAELISGARTPRDRASIEDLLTDLAVQETTLAHWIRVGELRQHLSRRGVSVSVPDAHVAQCALDRNAVLLSRDTVFPDIAAVTRLRLLTE